MPVIGIILLAFGVCMTAIAYFYGASNKLPVGKTKIPPIAEEAFAIGIAYAPALLILAGVFTLGYSVYQSAGII